ncbi:MAG: hypothetical protein ACI35J_03805 [Peribacillus sp.]
MDVKKRLSFTDGVQTVCEPPVKQINPTSKRLDGSYNTEELLELLGRLPAFAPKPVCKFTINGRTLFGKLEQKQESSLFIRHHFGKKVVKYHIEQLQSVVILKY